jgi:hypothetical protein
MMPAVRASLAAGLGVPAGARGLVNIDALADAMALDALDVAFLTVDLDPAVVSADLGLTFTADRGLVRLLAYGPKAAPRPGFVPPEALAFGAASFDFQAAWAALESMVNAANPALLAMAGAQVRRLVQDSGGQLDLRRDLLANLAGDFVMVQTDPSPPSPDDPASALVADRVVALTITDRQAFERAVETLTGLASRGAELFAARDHLGTAIHTLEIPRPAGGTAAPSASTFSYAFTDSHLLLGLGSTAALEPVLARMDHPRGRSAWQLQSVRATFRRLPPGALALHHHDLATVAGTLFRGLELLGRSGGVEICDPVALPGREVVERHLGAAVSGVYRDPGGLTLRLRMLAGEGRE